MINDNVDSVHTFLATSFVKKLTFAKTLKFKNRALR